MSSWVVIAVHGMLAFSCPLPCGACLLASWGSMQPQHVGGSSVASKMLITCCGADHAVCWDLCHRQHGIVVQGWMLCP